MKKTIYKKGVGVEKRKRLEPKKIAVYLNCSPSAISNYENSVKNILYFYDLKKLTYFFNVSIDYLVCLTDVWLRFLSSKTLLMSS